MIPRKISLEALRVFEVAARHLSFTKAAAELHMTQGAVSQRIKALETQLGAALFTRLTRALELSPQGQHLHEGLRAGFARIETALGGFRSADRAHVMTLTASPSVVTRWLMPRLNALAQLRPRVAVSVVADDRLLEIGVDADAALRFGSGRYRGLHSMRVGTDEVFPVCSPALLAANPAAGESNAAARRQAWRKLTRIVDPVAEMDRSGCGWRNWSDTQGVPLDEDVPNISFSHAHLALQAAVEGLGIAMARRVLVADDLAAGRLVRLGPAMPARFAYYFVTRDEPNVRSRMLAAWLQTQLANTA